MKFAFVTPRYGADIGAGPEHACRLIAEQVSARHDVDVLTTCARDPRTWKNEYSEGADRIRGVLVRRFPVTLPHDHEAFIQLTDRLVSSAPTRSEQMEWVRRLGPWSPALTDYLKRQHRVYDVIVFFSMCHATTVHGVPIAPDRSVVFPYLRWERTLRFGLWGELLSSPRAIGLFSAAERRLLHDYVRVTTANDEVVGIGVEPPPQQAYPRHQQDPADTVAASGGDEFTVDVADTTQESHLDARGAPFRRRHRLYGNFALYGGRVDTDNGCEEMLEYFDSYAAQDGDVSLVLMGVKMMKLPDERYLRSAGVLPDRERLVAYEAADVTIAPSPDDLLAQSVLESLAVGTPVLANAQNEAAVDHCRRANGGLYYANREEFVEALRLLTSDRRLCEVLGENGRTYVRQNYRWEGVLGRFERLISKARAR